MLYLDTNIFIKAMEARDAEADIAWAILRAIAANEVTAVTSELTLAEVLPRPMSEGDHQLIEAYDSTLRSGAGLIVATITRTILRQAAEIRSRTPDIRLPDAIHLATAVEYGCVALLSNDRRLRGKTGLTIVNLTSVNIADLKSLTS